MFESEVLWRRCLVGWWSIDGCSGEEHVLFGGEDIKELRGSGGRWFIH